MTQGLHGSEERSAMPMPMPERATATDAPAPATSPVLADGQAIAALAQSIAGETGRDRLLEVLLPRVLGLTGAETGLLVSCRHGDLCIEARAQFVDGAIRMHVGARALPDSFAPSTVLQYVAQTRQTVRFDAAAAPDRFDGDPYLQTHRPRAVLCTPMMQQDRLVGMIHLEHGRNAGVFTPSAVATLGLLAAQATMALAHAWLFELMRHEIAERERAQALLAGEKRLLETIASGASLTQVLDQPCRRFDDLSPGLHASILILDPHSRRMRHGADQVLENPVSAHALADSLSRLFSDRSDPADAEP
ncbi:MAG: GAF domain-containing protein [Rhodoferax sp.]|nr:GAF domain-containing protein [Rhodoferax sp.]MCB2040392.1 GAF domain-containing protein [Rhodoferax sp.]MCP5260187.1 GAF domain-containing protein [Rhodoferax sp.]